MKSDMVTGILTLIGLFLLTLLSFYVGYTHGYDECFTEMTGQPKRIIFQTVD